MQKIIQKTHLLSILSVFAVLKYDLMILTFVQVKRLTTIFTCVCVYVCVHACVHACVRACVCVCVMFFTADFSSNSESWTKQWCPLAMFTLFCFCFSKEKVLLYLIGE